MMPTVKHRVDLDLLTVNNKVNGSSKTKMQLRDRDINYCQYKHKEA